MPCGTNSEVSTGTSNKNELKNLYQLYFAHLSVLTPYNYLFFLYAICINFTEETKQIYHETSSKSGLNNWFFTFFSFNFSNQPLYILYIKCTVIIWADLLLSKYEKDYFFLNSLLVSASSLIIKSALSDAYAYININKNGKLFNYFYSIQWHIETYKLSFPIETIEHSNK